MQNPKHDLETIKAICEKYIEGVQKLVNFTYPNRSIECVVKVLRCSAEEAAKVIVEGILLLGKNDFAHSIFEWNEVADVYGLFDYKNENWYIKVMIYNEDGEEILEGISFHLPDQGKETRLGDGRVLKRKGSAP